MTRVDWIALAVVLLSALGGLRRGLVGTILSVAGLVAGAYLGSRLGPHFLHGGTSSPYTPVGAFVGAVVGVIVLQTVASLISGTLRRGLRLVPALRVLDAAGGLLAGAAWGLAIVWIAGAVALQIPGQSSFRDAVQGSKLLRRLNEIAPPSSVLRALERIDPLPAITGPAPPALPPDPGVLAELAVRRAAPSVLRITASACGLGIEGSGWVARPHLVVTAAHVVAGANGIRVGGKSASVWAIDRRNDIAVLDVPALDARPLPFADPVSGEPVAILGYPENGPFDARPGRIGATSTVLIDGSSRLVTAFNGLVRHGNSGGPAVDSSGTVRTTVFATRVGSAAGYGIPAGTVRHALADARHPVSTGSC